MSRDYIWVTVVRFLSKFVNLIFFSYIARILSFEDLAIYGYIFTSSILFSILFDFGFRNTIARIVGQGGDMRRVSGTQNTFFLSALSLQFLAAYALLNYFILPGQAASFDVVILFFIISSCMTYIRSSQGVLIGSGDVAEYNRSELAPRLALLCGTLFLVFRPSVGLFDCLLVLSFSQVFGVLYLSYVRYSSGHLFSISLLPIKDMRRLIYDGGLFMLSVLLMNLSKRANIYALSDVEGGAGVYFALLRASEVMTEVALGISVVILSRIATSAGSKKDDLEKIARTCRLSMLMLLPFVLFILLFRDYVLIAVVGPDFISYVDDFAIITLASYFGLVTTLVFPSLASRLGAMHMIISLLPALIILLLAYLYISFYSAFNVSNISIVLLLASIVSSLGILLVIRIKFSFPILKFLIVSSREVKDIVRKK